MDNSVLKLWVLEHDDPDWDEYEGFVVWARDEDEARGLAQNRETHVGYEKDPAKWLLPSMTTCVEVTRPDAAEIVLGAFHAG